jgi:hypothetical protein
MEGHFSGTCQRGGKMFSLLAPLLWIAGSTIAIFAVADSYASPALKKQLNDFIRSKSDAVNNLPDIAAALFTRVFGERHFSLRCVLASIVASVLSIFIMYALRLLLKLWVFAGEEDGLHQFIDYLTLEFRYPIMEGVREGFLISFLANLVLDYISLFKTRLIIKFLSRRKFSIIRGGVFLACDFALGFLLFQTFYLGFYFVSAFLTIGKQHVLFPAAEPYSILVMFEVTIALRYLTFPGYPPGTFINFVLHSNAKWVILLITLSPLFITSVFFYASIMPSVWLWVFVIAGLLSRRIAPLYPTVLYALNFEQNPIKMIGILVAASVMLFGLAIFGTLFTLIWMLSLFSGS